MKANRFEIEAGKDLQRFIERSEKRIDKAAIAVNKSQDVLRILSDRVDAILGALSAFILAITESHKRYESKVQDNDTLLTESILEFTDTIDKLKG